MAREPIKSVGCPSGSGAQLVPPLLVFHMPPPAAATYIVFGSVGCAATALIRPETTVFPGACPLASGAGPSAVHAPTSGPALTFAVVTAATFDEVELPPPDVA